MISKQKIKRCMISKHELISVQIKLENADKALDKLKEENKELADEDCSTGDRD